MSSNYRISRNIWKPTEFTINTGLTGVSGVDQFELPLKSIVNFKSGNITPNYRFKVDWGDGVIENFTSYDQIGKTHSYTASGTYSIKIYGRCDALDFGAPSDGSKILNVEDWGNVNFRSFTRTLGNTTNLISITSTPPILESVTKLEGTFQNTSLTQSNLNAWDTSKITSLYRTFYQSTNLQEIDISSWDVSKVTDISECFQDCSNITELNLTSWDVSKVTDMTRCFQGCSSLNNCDVSGWDVSNVTLFTSLFLGCTLLDPQVSSWNFSKATNLANTFRQSNISSFSQSNLNLPFLTQAFFGFYLCSNLSSFYAPNLNAPLLINASFMFQATGLTEIQISTWTLSSLQAMNAMFNGTQLSQIDTSGMLISSNLTNISSAFANISPLTTATISNLINDSNTGGPFLTFAGCSSLTSVDTVNWTRQMTTFQSCFLNCTSLTDIDVTNWDTTIVTSFESTFDGCIGLTQIDCGGWTISSLATATNMFRGVTLSQTSYDSLLIGWVGWAGGTATRPVGSSVSFHAGNSKYSASSDAELARNYLVVEKGWTIIDGGTATPIP